MAVFNKCFTKFLDINIGSCKANMSQHTTSYIRNSERKFAVAWLGSYAHL